MRRFLLLGFVAAGLGASALGLLAWAFLPDLASTPAVNAAALSTGTVTPVAEKDPTAAAREGRRARSEARAARRAERQQPKQARMVPEAKADARVDQRTDQATDLLLRLEDHAEKAGWDDQTLDDVEAVLLDTTDTISETLAAVDRKELRWDEVKADVRQTRIDQAAQIEALIGPEKFEAMAADIGLHRFEGDEPIRGRLEGRGRARAAASPHDAAPQQ